MAARARDQAARDGDRQTYAATFGRQLAADEVLVWLRSLSGLNRSHLTGHDSVAIDVVGTPAGLRHLVRLPAASAEDLLRQLQTAIPAARLVPADAPSFGATVTRELHTTQLYRLLRIDLPAATAAGLLAALGPLKPGEELVWQWVLRPAGGDGQIRPSDPAAPWGGWGQAARIAGFWSPQPTAGDGQVARAKAREPLFVACGRIGARAATPARARHLLGRLERVAGSLSAPGIQLKVRSAGRRGARRLNAAIMPLLAIPALLNARELVGVIGLPIAGPMVPGLAYGPGRLLPPTADTPSRGRVLGDALAPGVERPVALSERGSMEHLAVFAPTGGGKTTLLASLALGDIDAGRAVIVIDPKGGLVERLLERIPVHRLRDCIVVDPADELRPVPLPLLAAEAGTSPEQLAESLVGILQRRYGDLGPRSTDLLRSSLTTIAHMPGATVMDLFRLWGDLGYRAGASARVAGDPILRSFWTWFAQLAPAERAAMLAAPMNKLRPILARRAVRNLLASTQRTFSMGDVLARRQVLLVNLAEGVLGSDVTNLVGGVLIAQLWQAIQARARIAPEARPPAFVTIDEAPRFLDTPVDLGDMLVLAREYRVGLTIAAQSPSQFPHHLRELVMNSARSKLSFQASGRDSRTLTQEFGPLVTPDALDNLPPFEALARLSVGGAVADPVSIRTRPLRDPIPGRAAEVRAASRARYGVDRATIEAAFETRPDGPAEAPVGRGRA